MQAIYYDSLQHTIGYDRSLAMNLDNGVPALNIGNASARVAVLAVT